MSVSNDQKPTVGEKPEKERSFKKTWVIGGLILLMVLVGISGAVSEPSTLTYNEFLAKVDAQEVQTIHVDLKSGSQMTVVLTNEEVVKVPNPKTDTFKVEMLEAGIEVVESNSSKMFTGLTSLLSLGLMGFLVFILSKSVGSFSKKEPITEKPQTRFDDVAGMDEVKEELSLLVQFLKNPKRFTDRGAHLPKGVVLYGDPGTGKTLLARAMAGEADVPFFNVSGSDFVELFAGMGAKRVRELFKEAREQSPCIIFIDEIDAVGGKRTEQIGNGEGRQTLNALLSEMDGFEESEGVLVICATNRLTDLDPALIRPGRFDKQIRVPLPQTANERLAILNLYRKGRQFAEDLDFESLAKETMGFSPADLEVLMNEATLIAIQSEKDEIDQACLDDAFYKKLLKGHAKKESDRTPEEVELVAWHEAGHAVMAHAVGVEVSKVTIIPSTSGAGGVNFMIPKRLGMYSLEELEDQVKISYAGRCAEYLLLGTKSKITTGAEADIQQATKILYQMVVEQGMSEQQGLVNLNLLQVKPETYLPEIIAWSQRLENETMTYLETNQTKLQAVAEALMEKETLNRDELLQLLTATEKLTLEKAEPSEELA